MEGTIPQAVEDIGMEVSARLGSAEASCSDFYQSTLHVMHGSASIADYALVALPQWLQGLLNGILYASTCVAGAR